MAPVRGVRVAGAGVLAVAGVLAGGCASPGSAPVSKPPGVVVPGVVPGPSGSPASGGAGGSAALSGSVLLGGWAPGGPRNPVAAGALAYFRWLNARGGVYGRALDYRVLDDGGSARVVPSLVHRLVQGESVFAVFGVQGAQGAALTGFLDTAGVPDVFAGPGCGCTGVPPRLAMVFGWAVGLVREGNVLGAYVAKRYAGGRIAVAYGPDPADRGGLAAFLAAARGVRVAARTAVASAPGAGTAVAAAKAARAGVLVAFTPPGVVAALGAAMARARWRAPLVAVGSGLASGLPDGVITDGFLPSAGSVANGPAGRAAGTWLALFRKVRDRYLPRVPFSPALIGGMAAAYEMAAALFRAGPGLTRPGLVAALNGLPPGPAAAPLAYLAADHGGATGAYVGVIRAGVLVPLTGAWVTDPTPGGPVAPYAGVQAASPPGGVPPH